MLGYSKSFVRIWACPGFRTSHRNFCILCGASISSLTLLIKFYMAAEAGILFRYFHEGQWIKSQSTRKKVSIFTARDKISAFQGKLEFNGMTSQDCESLLDTTSDI
jgi:hypothetical protein